jgi:type III pantothenate kinase
MDDESMRDWLFDLGNTRLKGAPWQADGGLGAVQAQAHAAGGNPAGYDAVLPAAGRTAYLASVAAPALRLELLDALCRRFERIAIARSQCVFDDLRIAYADPDALGVDRFLAMLGARAQAPHAALVVGVGTALTLDLIDADGRHRGGRIAPSPTLMRQALHARVPQLPESGGGYAEFADATAPALASGCEGAALALIERSFDAATTLLGVAPRLWLHGGGADALRPRLAVAEPEAPLVLLGLARWAAVEQRGGAAALGTRPPGRVV